MVVSGNDGDITGNLSASGTKPLIAMENGMMGIGGWGSYLISVKLCVNHVISGG